MDRVNIQLQRRLKDNMNPEKVLIPEASGPELAVDSVMEVLGSELVLGLNGKEYRRQLVDVYDESDPIEVAKMREIGDAWEGELRKNPDWDPPVADPYNPGKLIIPEENKAALWLYRDFMSHKDEGFMEAWAANLFPTARALFPLQRLEDGGRVLSDSKIEERAHYLFSTMVDGLGLRSRARIYAEELLSVASESSGERLKIVSLGCGAGVPNIDATVRIEKELGKAVDWDLYDLDTVTLGFAQELVEESPIQNSTFNYGPTEAGSERLLGRVYSRAFGLPKESVDVVDALGLWEYIPHEKAVKFAQKSYDLVKPGGRVIISNMLPDRPQVEFNQRAVGWPGLYLRSDDELLEIIDKAGIDTSQVTMTHSTDGVYVVVDIRKP